MPQNFPQKALFALILGLIFWFSGGYLLPLLLPFLVGGALAMAAEPTVRLLCSKAHLPRLLATAAGVSGVCVLTVAAIGLPTALFARQMQHFSSLLPQLEQAATDGLQTAKDQLSVMAARLPGSLGKSAPEVVSNLLSDSSSLLRQAAQALPQMAGSVLSNVSKGLFGVATAIISAYMISGRLPRLKVWLNRRLPDSWQQKYRPLLRDLRRALLGWLRAEAKLAAVAFVILAAGFWLLRIQSPLTIAALVTVVDAFPVLGVGTVLVPWGAICLLQGQTARGIGILGLFSVIWLARSILEPKLLGKSMGLDPLLTLVAIYVGFQLWGVAGMLLAPILALMASQTVKQLQR